MSWCCCWWDWHPRQGPAELQPAVYQRRCPNWVLFPNPALTPTLMRFVNLFLGLIQSSWSLWCFQMDNVLSFIQEANFLNPYMSLCWVSWKLDVVIPGDCGPYMKDTLSDEAKGPACCPSPLVSREKLFTQDEKICLREEKNKQTKKLKKKKPTTCYFRFLP